MNRLSDDDIYLFNEGTHWRLYQSLGGHLEAGGGATFGVWAPNAARVSVIGDFNGWNRTSDPLQCRGQSGIWQGHLGYACAGARYKYFIESRIDGYTVEKADPFGNTHEVPPKTASILCDLAYDWHDAGWLQTRRQRISHDRPLSIYELHLGSWRRSFDGGSLSYRDMAQPLADHVRRCGFTHVELMPVMEHPFYGSWGYQVTGYFAPTSRYGSPQDLMYLIDVLHQHDIGVLLDWVPAHFPTDEHGLGFFDGTHLFEHSDPRQGFHPDWTSYIYNYGRLEVRSFLISSAMFWLDRYHVDGLRVDGVASMLYRDYSRADGEWIANEDGSNHNREAIEFLKRLNEAVYAAFPDTQMIAEESTAWPNVSRPTSVGGLGFGFKWDMGWMHDTLEYFKRDPVHRKHHHDELTFRSVYMHTENYVLPLSHDEVVHGKGALLDRMPGDEWSKLAQLRLLLGYQWALPGKKLLFMGNEIGSWHEWSHEGGLDWALLDRPLHAGLVRWVGDLNRFYCSEPAMYERDTEIGGFEWIEDRAKDDSVLALLRRGTTTSTNVACLFNFTPIARHDFRVGLPYAGQWEEVLNSDAQAYAGSGDGNLGQVSSAYEGHMGRPASATVNLPPYGCVFLRGAPAQ